MFHSRSPYRKLEFWDFFYHVSHHAPYFSKIPFPSENSAIFFPRSFTQFKKGDSESGVEVVEVEVEEEVVEVCVCVCV